MLSKIGPLIGLVIAFVLVWVLMAYAPLPASYLDPSIISHFNSAPDLERKLLVIIDEVLYPPSGISTVAMLSWGAGGLVTGLITQGPGRGLMAAIMSVILGVVLVWLFYVALFGSIGSIFSSASLIQLDNYFMHSIWGAVSSGFGGLLGGAINRESLEYE